MIKGDAAERTKVDVDASGPTELVESPLPSEGNRQSSSAVANVGGFFEAFFCGKGGDSLCKWFEEEIGFTCEAPHCSFHYESVLLGIDTTSARAE